MDDADDDDHVATPLKGRKKSSSSSSSPMSEKFVASILSIVSQGDSPLKATKTPSQTTVQKLRKEVLLSLQLEEDDKTGRKLFKKAIQSLEADGSLSLDAKGNIQCWKTNDKDKKKKKKKKTTKEKEEEKTKTTKTTKKRKKKDANQEENDNDDQDDDDNDTPKPKSKKQKQLKSKDKKKKEKKAKPEAEEEESDDDDDETSENDGDKDETMVDIDEEEEDDDSNDASRNRNTAENDDDDEEDDDDDENKNKKKTDDSSSKNASCQGNPQGITRLFVGNLPFRVDEALLCDFFQPRNDDNDNDDKAVTHIKWITDVESGKFYGSAFVELSSSRSAAHAVQHLNGQELLGRPLKLNFAPARPGDVWPPKTGGGTKHTAGGQAGSGKGRKSLGPPPEGCLKLFIGNLSYDIDDDGIHKFFQNGADAELKAVRWLHHRESGDFKGCGFVEFWNTQACQRAADLNGKTLLGRPIRIDWTD